MKKVRMLRSIAGDDFRLGKGQELELEDELALGWESANVCIILDSVSATEVKRFDKSIHQTADRIPEEKAIKIIKAPIVKPKETRSIPVKKPTEAKKQIMVSKEVKKTPIIQPKEVKKIPVKKKK